MPSATRISRILSPKKNPQFSDHLEAFCNEKKTCVFDFFDDFLLVCQLQICESIQQRFPLKDQQQIQKYRCLRSTICLKKHNISRFFVFFLDHQNRSKAVTFWSKLIDLVAIRTDTQGRIMVSSETQLCFNFLENMIKSNHFVFD